MKTRIIQKILKYKSNSDKPPIVEYSRKFKKGFLNYLM